MSRVIHFQYIVKNILSHFILNDFHLHEIMVSSSILYLLETVIFIRSSSPMVESMGAQGGLAPSYLF